MAFSPDGKWIASAGNGDERVKVWDASSGRELASFPGGPPVSFAPTGQLAARGRYSDIILWNVATGSTVMSLRGHDGPINSISFSPDGKRIVSGSNDRTVKLWDMSTGDMLMTLRGHKYFVASAVFTPDSKQIVSGSSDGTIRIWDATYSYELVRLIGHHGTICWLAYSPDGRQIASVDDTGAVKLWDVEHGTEVATLHDGAHGIPAFPSVAFSPDSKRVAAAVPSPGGIKIWDAATGLETVAVSGHDETVTAVAFSLDGKHIASGSSRALKVWDAASGSELVEFRGPEDSFIFIAFSPDGRFIASGGFDPNITVWEWEAGSKSLTLRSHHQGIGSLAFSPDGKRIISGHGSECIVWDATLGTELMTVESADLTFFSAFSPDGSRMISGGRDRRVRVWDAETGVALLSLRTGFGTTHAVFSPDGKTIACGTMFNNGIMLFESEAPPGGYEARKKGMVARKTAGEMYAKHGSYHEVIENLQGDMSLDGVTRKLALQTAHARQWEDVEKFKNEAWEILRSPNQNIDQYRTALAKIEKANVWEPNDLAVLRRLGAAQYRAGKYEQALKTLQESRELSTSEWPEGDWITLTFTAMALRQLGQDENAMSTLGQLRALLQKERFADDQEAKALLAEAVSSFAEERR